MFEVTTEVEIAAPPAGVARFAADPGKAPQWFKHVVEADGQPPLAAGSKFTLMARMAPGVRRSFPYEVVEAVDGSRLVFRTDAGPFPMETTYTWAGHNGGTVMTFRNRVSPRGPARLFAPLMARAMRRANRGDLLRLKSILEQEG
jgi:uncharacterized protein YndB with AHSA1/START domain